MSYLIEWTTSKGKKKTRSTDSSDELSKIINHLDEGLEKGSITGYLITSI